MCLASDSSGTRFAYTKMNGDIWTYNSDYTTSAALTGEQGSTLRLIYTGSGVFYVLNPAGLLSAF